MFARLHVLAILLYIFSFSANAQQYPPVYLNISPIPQETATWCWAAVAQQIIFARQGNAPPQCAMVSMANNAHPATCCNSFGQWNGNPGCLVPGSLSQIQNLILYFGGHYSNIAPPADPLTIYNALQRNHPIIMFVRQSAFQQIGHFVVITGIAWVNNGFGFQPVLYINDPMGFITQPIPFVHIAQFWEAAIVIN